MKKYLIPIITGLVLGAIGFFIGQTTGSNSSDEENLNTDESIESNMGPLGKIKDNSSKKVKDLSYSELKEELLKKEKENMLKYIEITGEIEERKEGPMFNKEYVKYFSGFINNKAIILPIKDVSVKVDYYSFTDAFIRSETVIIYDFFKPQNSSGFSEKMNVPDDCMSIKYKILEAKSAEKEYKEMTGE